MNTIRTTGACIIGTCKGIAQRSITNRKTGEISTITELGLSNIVVDDFGYEKEEEIRIAISKSLIEKGHISKLTALRDQTILIPVWYRAYATKSGAGITPYLANDWDQKYTVIPETMEA